MLCHSVRSEEAQRARPVPIGLQPLCRGDGLGPKPLRHATVPGSDVAPRPPSSPLPVAAAAAGRRVYLHSCQIGFSRLAFRAAGGFTTQTDRDNKKEKTIESREAFSGEEEHSD